MLGYSVAQYLSRFQVNTPLWGEKLVPLLDYTFSNTYVNNEELSKPFYEIVDKYVNTTQLSLRSIRNFVKEMGYSYILDFFNPDEEGAQRLVAFLIVIHFLKGSRKGLELCLNIMKIQGTISEWYETDPLGVVNTFTLTVDSNTLVNNNLPETYRNFERFIKSYVYPEVRFVVIYTGFINHKIYTDLQGTMIIKYPCYVDGTSIGLELQKTITHNLVTGIDWVYDNCYKDDLNRIIPYSTEVWTNINSQYWDDIGLYYGIDGTWGNPCSIHSEVESTVFDIGEILNTQIILNYNVQKSDPSSSVSIKIRTSLDNITWSNYTNYINIIRPLRYYQIKVEFMCPDGKLVLITD